MESSGYTTKSSFRWNRQWGLRVQTGEGVRFVPIKTRQPTHVSTETMEFSQTLFDDLEDQKVVFRATRGRAARVIREERCETMLLVTRDQSNVLP